MNLSCLFNPESVAIVGASSTKGKIGYETMVNAAKFDGRVYPVNPTAEGTVLGEEFVASVSDIDDSVDLALLCVPGPSVPDILEECAAADVGGVVIFASGFAEAGPEGEKLQKKITTIAAEHELAMLGPNTSGFVVPGSNLLATFARGVKQFRQGNVAILAQSGGVANQLAFQALREGRGVSAMIGLGNRANIGFREAIKYFDNDPVTDAIVLHVEGTDDGRSLLESCRTSGTPIIAYKVGQSNVGEFAESHTGTLTGDHDVYTSGFAQYGVPTVDSVAALFDAGVALANSPAPEGKNVGVVTAQAGPGIIVADRLQRAGATLPPLGTETKRRIEDILPGITFTGNPVDTGRPMPEFGEVIETIATDDSVDIVLVYELYEESIGFPIDTLVSLTETVEKPILFATQGPLGQMDDELVTLREAGVPTFTSPERAAEATALVAKYARLKDITTDEDNVTNTEVNSDV